MFNNRSAKLLSGWSTGHWITGERPKHIPNTWHFRQGSNSTQKLSNTAVVWPLALPSVGLCINIIIYALLFERCQVEVDMSDTEYAKQSGTRTLNTAKWHCISLYVHHMQACTRAQTHTHTQRHTHTQTHTETQIDTHTHTYTQTHLELLLLLTL